MVKVASIVFSVLICGVSIASCNDENAGLSSSDVDVQEAVKPASVDVRTKTAEELRIEQKLALEEKQRASEELRIEKKLKVAAEKKEAELQALADQVHKREKRSQEELDRGLIHMNSIQANDGSDQILTGGVNQNSN